MRIKDHTCHNDFSFTHKITSLLGLNRYDVAETSKNTNSLKLIANNDSPSDAYPLGQCEGDW